MNEELRLQLWNEISNYLFACFQWASSFDDGHGHFNVLALQPPKSNNLFVRLLQYQRDHHPVYQKYCDISGVADEGKKVTDWPPLPVECFKRAEIWPFGDMTPAETFHSSGTTENVRSTHRFRDPGLMQRAIIYHYSSMIGRHGVPDNAIIISLMPSHDDQPSSSLAYMISFFMNSVGAPGSRSYFSMQDGLDIDGIKNTLRQAYHAGQPVHLMGPAFAFVQLIDAIGDEYFLAAPGSACLETGGYKGKTHEIPKSELRDMIAKHFGIDRRRIYGEYGMCELSSQCYEICALNAPVELIPEEGLFVTPPWMRCIIYSPETMRPVLPDHDGQIAFLDLANIDSAAFILTGDIGRLVPLGDTLRSRLPGHPAFALKLQGRSKNAVPKGCSIAWDEWNSHL